MSPDNGLGSEIGLSRARVTAYSLRFLVGLSTGFYILVYLAAIGDSVAERFGLNSVVIGMAVLGFTFAVEYLLEVIAGAWADKHGTKRSFVASFILRAFFSAAIALWFVWLPPQGTLRMVLAILAVMSAFAVAFTLFSGNYEEWLQRHCAEARLAEAAFSLSEVMFYAGLAVGALGGVLIPRGPSLIASSLAAVLAALTCLRIPAQDGQGLKSSQKRLGEFVAEANRHLRESLPELNHTFWAYALAYGITQAIEALLPLLYLSSVGRGQSLEMKLTVLVGCLWLPSLIGATARLSRRSAPREMNGLRRITLWFCGLSSLIAVTSLIPGRIGHLGLIVAIIATRFAFGFLRPAFMNFNSYRVKVFYSNKPKEDPAPKTLLSIGEQRQKLGAILSTVMSALIAIFAASKETVGPFYIAIGIMAIVLATYAIHNLRLRDEHNDTKEYH